MYLSGKVMKSISSEESKGWRKFLHFCSSETTAFIKNGSDYSGHWEVKVSVNPKLGTATLSHHLVESSSTTLTSLKKDYERALEEGKLVFAGIDSVPVK
jgi:hypothetical protein